MVRIGLPHIKPPPITTKHELGTREWAPFPVRNKRFEVIVWDDDGYGFRDAE